jgi:hypothetical protein
LFYGLFAFAAGFGVCFRVLFIVMLSSGRAGGTSFGFSGRACCCLRSVSSSGIPGVGVPPGFGVLPIALAGGIPGAGFAPVGSTLEAFTGGMPGVVLDEGGTGLVENPGGRSGGFVLTAALEFEFALPGAPPHPSININIRKITPAIERTNIKYFPSDLK